MSPGHLARAQAALARHDHAAARDALLAAWRARRAPALAALVDLLDRQAPDALTAQLAALVTPRVVTSHAHLAALADVDDPRLAGWAIDALVALPFTAVTAERFLYDVVATAARHHDPRLAERADAIRAAVTTRLGRLAIRRGVLQRLDAALAALPAPSAPTAAELALERALATALAPLAARDRSAEALLAEIYAQPDDDGPRQVYADLLLEQGDVRGELINLQLGRGDDDAPSAREVELLKRHGKAWLGALAPVLSFGKGYSGTRFRRGFVATADIILSVGKKLAPLRTDPAWATVEALDGSWDFELLETAPLRALRHFGGGVDHLRALDAAQVHRLAARAAPLASVRRLGLSEPVAADVVRRAFPGLVTIERYVPTLGAADVLAYADCGAPHLHLRCWHVRDADADAVRQAFDVALAAIVGLHTPLRRLSLSPPFSRHPRPEPIELVCGADGRLVPA